MKNIHVLPTDKPSRLGYLTKKGKEVFKDLRLFDKPMPNILDSENQHIYITSDEEIKDKCYVLSQFSIGPLYLDGVVNTASMLVEGKWKKIILTTDRDLIKDGVQAIHDEFLEWFVKNPSCEFVEVQNQYRVKSGTIQEHKDGLAGYEYYEYKIIIPQEEPKLTFEEYEQQGLEKYSYELKQETLENESIFKNKKWYSENGTVYNEADDSVRIALVFDNGSYMNLPIEIANKISQLLNN
jgi:hypothetical protein